MSLSLPRIYLADIPKTLNGQKTDKNMSTLQSIYSTLTIRTTHELAPEKKNLKCRYSKHIFSKNFNHLKRFQHNFTLFLRIFKCS